MDSDIAAAYSAPWSVSQVLFLLHMALRMALRGG